MKWATFWDDVHREGTGCWLTDTPPEDYIRNLHLNLSGPQRIMEIGIGRGLMVRYMLRHDHEVTAVDISGVALYGLPLDVAAVRADLMASLPSNSRDLAISYLTLQHVGPEMAKHIIKHAVRICGVFKFQMASLICPGHGVTGYTAKYSEGGPLFMHKISDFEEALPEITFKRLGGKPHPAQNIAWHFVEAK